MSFTRDHTHIKSSKFHTLLHTESCNLIKLFATSFHTTCGRHLCLLPRRVCEPDVFAYLGCTALLLHSRMTSDFSNTSQELE